MVELIHAVNQISWPGAIVVCVAIIGIVAVLRS